MPPVVGAAPALAKDTAGAEPAGEAEKVAAAARPEALLSWAQDKVMRGLEVETPPQEGEHMHEPPLEALPPEGRHNLEAPPQKRKHEADVPPQSNPNKGELEPGRSSRELSREGVLSTWERPGPWDPGEPPS